MGEEAKCTSSKFLTQCKTIISNGLLYISVLKQTQVHFFPWRHLEFSALFLSGLNIYHDLF
jgi:hypothetical protein